MNKNSGFTLIETLVVIAIIVIITTSGLVVSINSYRIKSLEAAESMLKTALTKARDEAFFGKKPADCIGPNPEDNITFDGNILEVSKDDNGYFYELRYVCEGVSGLVSKNYFGGNIEVSPTDQVFFSTVKREVPNPTTFQICINDCDSSNYDKKQITVDAYGNFSYNTL